MKFSDLLAYAVATLICGLGVYIFILGLRLMRLAALHQWHFHF